MSEPIVEQIAAKIATQLATVTTGNGYQQSVASVIRPTRYTVPPTPTDRMVVLTQLDPSVIDGPHMFSTWRQPFAIDLFLRPSDTSTTILDLLANRFRSDVEKAIMAKRTWDGLAIDTRIDAPQSWIRLDDNFEGVTVNISVDYRTKELDPYDQT